MAKSASLKKQISSTRDDLKFITEQLEIQKKLESSKQSLFELDLVSETQVLAERNKRLSLEKEYTKTSNKLSELKSNKEEYMSKCPFIEKFSIEKLDKEGATISIAFDDEHLEWETIEKEESKLWTPWTK